MGSGGDARSGDRRGDVRSGMPAEESGGGMPAVAQAGCGSDPGCWQLGKDAMGPAEDAQAAVGLLWVRQRGIPAARRAGSPQGCWRSGAGCRWGSCGSSGMHMVWWVSRGSGWGCHCREGQSWGRGGSGGAAPPARNSPLLCSGSVGDPRERRAGTAGLYVGQDMKYSSPPCFDVS